jgi:hypothetical protein
MVFHSNLFPRRLVFVGKATSLLCSRALERCVNTLGFCLTVNIRESLKGLPRANTITFYEHL